MHINQLKKTLKLWQQYLYGRLDFFAKKLPAPPIQAHQILIAWRVRLPSIQPSIVYNAASCFFMLAAVASATFWIMQIEQMPNSPEILSSGNKGKSKGVTLYIDEDEIATYSLFGRKPLVADNILLRGVVITAKNKDGLLDGFALFEIDGKPTDAISVGESVSGGLMLQGIAAESATLLFQGQTLEFTLNKNKKGAQTNTP
jgi:hypothetical protein